MSTTQSRLRVEQLQVWEIEVFQSLKLNSFECWDLSKSYPSL